MINKHMIKLPSAVANMKMSDFLREHGGSITAANEHKKNAARQVLSFTCFQSAILIPHSIQACENNSETHSGYFQVRQCAQHRCQTCPRQAHRAIGSECSNGRARERNSWEAIACSISSSPCRSSSCWIIAYECFSKFHAAANANECGGSQPDRRCSITDRSQDTCNGADEEHASTPTGTRRSDSWWTSERLLAHDPCSWGRR